MKAMDEHIRIQFMQAFEQKALDHKVSDDDICKICYQLLL